MSHLIAEAPVTLAVAQGNRKFVNIPKEVFEKMASLGFDSIGNGGYTNWVLDKYLKSEESNRPRFVEDLYKVADSLKLFNVKKNKGFWKDPKDINQYKTIQDLESTTEKYVDAKAKNDLKVSSTDVSEADVDTVYDDGEWTIKVPKTREASCVLGRGTKWCTASQGENNMFDHYSKDGPLYVISNGTDKWQFHSNSGQFMDKKDSEVYSKDLLRFPEYILRFIKNKGYVAPKGLLEAAVDTKDLDVVKHIYESGIIDADVMDDHEIMSTATFYGTADIVKYFISLGVIPDDTIVRNGILNGDMEMINLGTQLGFDPVSERAIMDNSRGAHGYASYLSLAIMSENIEVVKYVLDIYKKLGLDFEKLSDDLFEHGIKPTKYIPEFPELFQSYAKSTKTESYYSFINSYLTESLI